MVITRQELLQLVADDKSLLAAVYSRPESVLKQCKDNGKLEIFNFYDKCRKSYNQKHSKIYINIVKEVEDPKKVLTTLSALITQILLFAETSKNKDIFLQHARLNEVLDVLKNYAETHDLTACIALICDIKKDIKYLEQL